MEEINNIAFKKFQGSQLSPDEELMLSNWLIEKSNQEIFDDLHKVWKLTGKIEYAIDLDVDLEWESFKKLNTKTSITKVRALYFKVGAIAASIAILLGVFAGYNYLGNSKQIYTTSNHTLSILLSDNSEVLLNNNSELIVARSFNKKSRKVTLNGEAFFEISKNPNKPFVIATADNTYVKVLGTSFNLRAYESENTVELQVVSGKVKFGSENNNTILAKEQSISYNKNKKELDKPGKLNLNLMSWQTKKFAFDNSKLSEVILAFERYFGLKISVPDGADSLRFSGDFKNPTTQDFAKVLGVAFNWNYQIRKETIQFSKK